MRYSLHSTQLFENIDADHRHLRMQPWHPVPCLTSASQMSSMLLAMTLFLVMCSYTKIVIVSLKQRGMSITSTLFKKNKRVTAPTNKSVEVCTRLLRLLGLRPNNHDDHHNHNRSRKVPKNHISLPETNIAPQNGWFFQGRLLLVSGRGMNFEPTFSSPLFCGGTHGSPQRISHPHQAVNADGRPTPQQANGLVGSEIIGL